MCVCTATNRRLLGLFNQISSSQCCFWINKTTVQVQVLMLIALWNHLAGTKRLLNFVIWYLKYLFFAQDHVKTLVILLTLLNPTPTLSLICPYRSASSVCHCYADNQLFLTGSGKGVSSLTERAQPK